MQNALFAVKNSTDRSVCRGAQPGCVPWNIWKSVHSPSKAALAYISTPGLYSAQTAEDVVSAYVSGDLTSRGVKTPWANDGLKSRARCRVPPDTLTTTRTRSCSRRTSPGFGSPIVAVNALAHVWEAFTEARMPIVRDAPLVKSLDLRSATAIRATRKGSTQITHIFRASSGSPTSDVRFRGAYTRRCGSRTCRNSSQPQHVGLDGSTDFCAALRR